MNEMAYKEAYLTLMVDMKAYYSPVKDISKYLNKMTMIGKKYHCLEMDVRNNLRSQCGLKALESLESVYTTELDVLDFMAQTTIEQFKGNKKLAEAMDGEDKDLEDMVDDFQIIRLAVKSRAMSAKAEMHELLDQLNRHKSSLLVK